MTISALERARAPVIALHSGGITAHFKSQDDI